MSEHPTGAPARERNGSSTARKAWMAGGITVFAIGVVFTLTMPDNVALDITALGLGVVLFSVAGARRSRGSSVAGVAGAAGVAGDAGAAGVAGVAGAAPPSAPSPEASRV